MLYLSIKIPTKFAGVVVVLQTILMKNRRIYFQQMKQENKRCFFLVQVLTPFIIAHVIQIFRPPADSSCTVLCLKILKGVVSFAGRNVSKYQNSSHMSACTAPCLLEPEMVISVAGDVWQSTKKNIKHLPKYRLLCSMHFLGLHMHIRNLVLSSSPGYLTSENQTSEPGLSKGRLLVLFSLADNEKNPKNNTFTSLFVSVYNISTFV